MIDNNYIKKISQLSGLSFNKVKKVINSEIDLATINIANNGKAITPIFTLEVDKSRDIKISITEKFKQFYRGQVTDDNVKDRIHDK